jgi:hypothetical protein
LDFSFLRVAQYFFIRADTTFLAAADMPLRLPPADFFALMAAHRARWAVAIALRPAADSLLGFLLVTVFFGLVPLEASPPPRSGNVARIAALSCSSSKRRAFAPTRARFIKVFRSSVANLPS